MNNSNRSKVQGTGHYHRLSNNLFGNQSNGDSTPQEIDITVEENLTDSSKTLQYIDPCEATPITVCRQTKDGDFMFDSLENQESIGSIIGSKDNLEIDASGFMSALQSAIHHFEKPVVLLKDMKHSVGKSRAANNQSPSLSNFTTTNSLNGREEVMDSNSLKKQYNELLAKYNNLKMSSKMLIKDYAILRSQFEEVNAVIYITQYR